MSQRITYKQAAAFILPFGPFEGRTLDAVASTENGLRYLDNLNGKIANRPGDLSDALSAYLADPTIAKELGDLVAAQRERYEQR